MSNLGFFSDQGPGLDKSSVTYSVAHTELCSVLWAFAVCVWTVFYCLTGYNALTVNNFRVLYLSHIYC